MVGWNEKIKNELGYCGQDVFIGHNTIFTNPSEVHLMDRVRIDPFCLITTGLYVGSNSQICSHAILSGGSQQKITLDGWTWIGYGSQLFTASEDYSGEHGSVCEFWGNNKIFRGDIYFKKYSGIASSVIVFPGITLPLGCAIGAQSLVHTKDKKKLKSWNIYIGNPLKHFRTRNSEKIMELAKDGNWRK
jgi:galactoside O-acetyltransferase